MVEDKLLRGERTHTVAQQDIRLARVLVLRDDSRETMSSTSWIKTAGSEFAKTSGGLCCQSVTSMIVSVNDKFSAHQYLSQFRIAANVLAKSMRDLNDSANFVLTAPFHTCNGKAVRACKF